MYSLWTSFLPTTPVSQRSSQKDGPMEYECHLSPWKVIQLLKYTSYHYLIYPKFGFIWPCCSPLSLISFLIMFHHFFLVGLSLFLHKHQHPCASALIPSNKCIVHRNHDAQCKKFSLKSNIYIIADSSLSSPQDVEGDCTRATTSSVKRWTIQGLTCNGCVERVRSFVQVRVTSIECIQPITSSDHPISMYVSWLWKCILAYVNPPTLS